MTGAPDWNFRKLKEVARALPAPETAPKDRLGKYRLVRELAEGAMGVVHEAEDTELRRTVAVKILREVLGANEVIRYRFQREARSAGMLSHPNVVQVYDSGEIDGRLFLVMELVRGRPLSDILGERRYEVRPMLQLLEKVARGVAAAHAAGIVHRDLKPANILVADSGEPKVGDFGLAHWLGAETMMTKPETPLGTPMYMSPEQVRGDSAAISPATDVYALGGILYEILTGRPPHVGDSAMEVYGRIIGDEPVAPRVFSDRIDRDLDTICLKALDKEPRRRYPTAAEFADDLRRHLDGESIVAVRPGLGTRGRKWIVRHRTWAAVLAVTLVSAAVLASVLTLSGFRQREDRRLAVDGHAADGRRARQERQRLQAEVVRLRGEEGRLASSIDAAAGEEEKRPLWAARKALRLAERTASERRDDAIAAYTRALAIDPVDPGSRSALAAIHFEEMERAEGEGNEAGAESSRKSAALFDDGTLAPRLVMRGLLSLDSSPAGAEVDLSRYEEAPDQRLLAGPPRTLGACPIRDASLEAGRYLAVLRKAGHRDVRLPFRIGRQDRRELKVNLYREEEIGAGYVFVPGGAGAVDFFIGRFEVTFGEYFAFLNALLAEAGEEETQKRVPRQAPRTGFILGIQRGQAEIPLPRKIDRDWPVQMISWEDADAYCAWLTRSRPEAGARYRLPTSAEWEKTARGGDGRAFPWGDRFDGSFCLNNLSNRHNSTPEHRVGIFPKDESPYGVRDLAGGVSEWCGDWLDATERFKTVCGGSWGSSDEADFRATQRGSISPQYTSASVGFRVVRVLDKAR